MSKLYLGFGHSDNRITYIHTLVIALWGEEGEEKALVAGRGRSYLDLLCNPWPAAQAEINPTQKHSFPDKSSVVKHSTY